MSEREFPVDDETGIVTCGTCGALVTKIPENHRGNDGKFHAPMPTICVGSTLNHLAVCDPRMVKVRR